jgi:hypothetical protein
MVSSHFPHRYSAPSVVRDTKRGDRDMKMFWTLALTASALVVATAAFAQVKKPNADPAPRVVALEGQRVTAPPPLTNPDASITGPRPLFKIGKVPVEVWAPVEPPYDAHLNRSEAADPIWEEGAGF